MIRDKLSLDDVEWGEFKFTYIFTEIFIAMATDSNKLRQGNIPYIGRSSINNGFQGEYDVDLRKKVNSNSITVSMVGEPRAYYQPYDFACSQNILVLRNDSKLNKHNSKFLCSIINQYLYKKGFGYGYPVGLNRVKRNSLLLPIDENGEPNWQFMEEYIKQEQKAIAQKVINYYEDKIIKTGFDLLGLEDLKWGNFKIGELFKFKNKPSKGLNNMQIATSKGISYLGATNRNNGVLEFVEENKKLTYDGNCIAFIRNGEGSMGYSIYKKEDFIATQDMSVGYNENLNEYNAQFITTIADRVRGKYNFGYKRNQTRLENEILTLPVDEKSDPNWDYMSKFMQKIEQEKLEKALNYIYIYKLAICEACKLPKLEEKEWSEFWLSDIVDIKSGIDIYERERTVGKTPYVTAKSVDNGIGYFVSNTNKTFESDCISINRNGSVGYAFYHPYPSLFGNDTRKLVQKNKNKYISIFMTRTLINQKEKYGYGYKMGTERLKRQKILLPVNNLGEPDYSYMKKYMQIEEIKQAYKIIDYYIKSSK